MSFETCVLALVYRLALIGWQVETQETRELIVLLAGGEQSTQAADIKTALRLVQGL